MSTQLSIVIVNTNERHVLRPCLLSLQSELDMDQSEVLVVDNASKDATREMLAEEFPWVKMVRSEVNLGFAAANNRGITAAAGRFVLLLNPDTEVLAGALRNAVAFMEGDPAIGISGCTLLYPDGRVQETVRTFPDFRNVCSEALGLYLLFPRSRVFGRYYLRYFDYSRQASVDWVLGAFFLIRREVIDAIGLLDERFFMYSEEVDYCYRARAAGFQVFYNPGARVIHHWGGPNTKNVGLLVWMHKSQMLYVKKHFVGVRKWSTMVAKLIGVGARIIPHAVIGLLTLNRQQQIKSYAYARATVILIGEFFRP